jgi:hypothetical protein
MRPVADVRAGIYGNKGAPYITICLSLVMLVVTAIALRSTLNSTGARAVRGAVIVAVGLGATLYIARSARVRVTVSDAADEFEVRNPIRRYTVKWSDVERFASGPGFYGAPLVEIHLKSGKRIKCYALAGRYPRRWGTTPGFVEEFNRMLAERTSSILSDVASGDGERP